MATPSFLVFYASVHTRITLLPSSVNQALNPSMVKSIYHTWLKTDYANITFLTN